MIDTYRNQVDAIDAGIVALLEERMDCSLKIGEYKEKHQMAVEDQGREACLLKSLRMKTKNEAYWEAIEVIYQEIFKVSKVAQTVINNKEEKAFSLAQTAQLCPQTAQLCPPTSVAYFGQQGSYTHEAMKRYFPNAENSQSYLSFETVVEAVVYGECDYGILPIENSSTGSIHAVYDLLGKEPIQIIGEICCPIEHYLMAAKGVLKADIQTVYSHPQALSQCERYLLKEGFIGERVDSSSKGASLVAPNANCGAIASMAAAKLYDLEILDGPIGDYEMNRTRFIVFEAIDDNLNEDKETHSKLSENLPNTAVKPTVIGISFQIPNQCGQLYQILNIFYETDLNLLKIESRPIAERPFEYQFYVDFEGQLNTEGVQSAIHRLEAKTTWLKVLGTWEKTI